MDFDDDFEIDDALDFSRNSYGIRIKNFDAKSIYFNNELNQKDYRCVDAVFANSLFCDYLKKNGLKIDEAKNFTEDIICIDFNSFSNPGKNEIFYFEYLINKTKDSLNAKIERLQNKIQNQKIKFNAGEISETEYERKVFEYQDKIIIEKDNHNEIIDELIEHKNFIEENKDSVPPKSLLELREDFYSNGVDIFYKDSARPVHYEMLYRSTGKAKNGSCMFIKKKLHKVALSYLRMGMKFPKSNCPIVELGAYSSLVASAIVGRIKIDPRKILVIEDIETYTTKKVVTVGMKSPNECVAKLVKNFKVKSTLFDGQALIEKSVFERAEFDNPNEKGNGFILLRNHFCKMAAFSTNIQEFFKDYCKDHKIDYETFMLSDMFGQNRIYAKDVEVITTNNSMKWTKDIFGISFDAWCEKVNEGENVFGIVKTAHKSKFGNVQRMSYQMVNALDIAVIPKILDATLNYVDDLKKNTDGKFLDYLENFKSFANDYAVLLELVKLNPDFASCEYFKDRKDDIIYRIVNDARRGKLLQNGDNLVIVGSPYAMLLAAAGEDIKKNPKCDVTLKKEPGTIQCYSERFADGEYLAEFRSPFNGKNNLGYLHNVYHPFLKKYFNFGSQIIAVNLIQTDFQARNNGSDQDSDSIYTTNEKNIVECAKKYYLGYPTIVNTIEGETKVYKNSMENFALVDYELSRSKLSIGESSNLAQLCLTYTYNFNDADLANKLCSLSVISQMSIDNAKRKFQIDIPGAIRNIRKDMNISERGYPKFWALVNHLSKDETDEVKISKLKCPMNSIKLNPKKYRTATISMDEFFLDHSRNDSNTKRARAVEIQIEEYMAKLKKAIINKADDEDSDMFAVLNSEYNILLDSLRNKISDMDANIVSWLINRAFVITDSQKRQQKNKNRQSKTSQNRPLLLKILFDLNKDAVFESFSKNTQK